MKKILLISITSLLSINALFAVTTTPEIVLAAGDSVPSEYTLLEPLPCIPDTSTDTPTCAKGTMQKQINLNTYLSYIFRLAIALAAIAAVFMITLGGFQYMISEGIGSKDAAKTRIWNAILGLLGAICSYIILYTINPKLVQINPTIDPIVVPQVQSVFKGLDDTLNNGIATVDTAKELRHEQTDALTKAKQLEDAAALDPTLSAEDATKYLAEAQFLRDKAKGLDTQVTFIQTDLKADIKLQAMQSKLNDASLANGTHKDSGELSTQADFAGDYKDMAKIFDENIASLKATNADPVAIEKMKDEKEYYLSAAKYQVWEKQDSLTLNGKSSSVGVPYVNNVILSIKQDYAKENALIQDPEIKEKLKAKTDQTLKNLGSHL